MTPFKRTYIVTVEAEAHGQVLGWGCAKHERAWLESQLAEPVTELVARFYQTDLRGAKVTVIEAPKEATQANANPHLPV